MVRETWLARCAFCQNNIRERTDATTTEERKQELQKEFDDHQCLQTNERVYYCIRQRLSRDPLSSSICITLDHASKKRPLNIFPVTKSQNLDDYLELSPGIKHS